MRLLNVHTFEFEQVEADPPPYAILSHRWTKSEARLADLERWRGDLPETHTKVHGLARYVKAQLPDVQWMWIDSCCLNQDSTAELSEGVNRMFGWYRDARVCFAYLPDVQHPSDRVALRQSVWFKRGWTLQELVASTVVIFLTSDWQVIGHKGAVAHLGERLETGPNLEPLLSERTRIPQAVLQDFSNGSELGYHEKMLWMEGRQTLKEEDMIYALFGILGVTPGANYGEGKYGAELRLKEEIQRRASYEAGTILGAKSKTSTTTSNDKFLDCSILFGASHHVYRLDREGVEYCESVNQENLDYLFRDGYRGVQTYIAMHCPGAINLGMRYREVLPKLNENYQDRWTLYIYCAPSVKHIAMALQTAGRLAGFKTSIRVDARLSYAYCKCVSCDTISSLENLATFLDKSGRGGTVSSDLKSHFDLSWLYSQIDELEDDDSDFFNALTLDRYISLAKEDERVAGIAVLSIATDIGDILRTVSLSKPATVRNNRTYRLKPQSSGDSWTLQTLGRL